MPVEVMLRAWLEELLLLLLLLLLSSETQVSDASTIQLKCLVLVVNEKFGDHWRRG